MEDGRDSNGSEQINTMYYNSKQFAVVEAVHRACEGT